MKYVINNVKNPTKFSSYNIDNIGNFMLSHEPTTTGNCVPLMCEGENSNPFELWTLHFDGACNIKGNKVGVLPISSKERELPHGFKLEFECTNNIVEYEALMLGLETTKPVG